MFTRSWQRSPKTSSRLNDSIGDLLDLSRLESDAWQPHFERYDVRDILGTVLSRLSAAQRERVRFDLADDLPDVRVDFAQLARALSNLVENALVYSPGRHGGDRRRARPSSTAVELWVEDSGPGVPDVREAARLREVLPWGGVGERPVGYRARSGDRARDRADARRDAPG